MIIKLFYKIMVKFLMLKFLCNVGNKNEKSLKKTCTNFIFMI